MGKMKHGTNVGLDKNYNNVCVGDTVRDDAGNEYIINAYGVAVDSAKGGTKKLSELKGIELVKSSETPPALEKEAPEALPAEDRQKLLKNALEALTDLDMVTELRSRGWTVTCEKMVERVVIDTIAL